MTDLEIPLGKRTKFYRFFEMLPAILSYLIILLPILLSFISPIYGATFIIIFIIIWFVKTIGMSYRTIQGYNTLQRAQKIDWKGRLHDLEDPAQALREGLYKSSWRHEVHQHNLEQLEATVNARKPSDIYNAVIVATYNE